MNATRRRRRQKKEEEEEEVPLILNPALALVSINIISCSFALPSPSSTDTCLLYQYESSLYQEISKRLSLGTMGYLLSAKSVLFPTNIITTSAPLSVRTSSIHFAVFRNDWRSIGIIIHDGYINEKQWMINNYRKHIYIANGKKKLKRKVLLVISYTITATEESRI